jgi:serine/threonine protein kinase
MEFVEGGTLHDCIQTSGQMSEETARRIIRQILCALEYMHERHQVSHRDLKPAVRVNSSALLMNRIYYCAIVDYIPLSRLQILDLRRSKQ